MQRIAQLNAIALLIVAALIVTGCCNNSPWCLVKKPRSWGGTELDYVVDAQGLVPDDARGDSTAHSVEAVVETGSPGIIADIEPIDAKTLFAAGETSEKKVTKTPDGSDFKSDIRQVSFDEPVEETTFNVTTGKSVRPTLPAIEKSPPTASPFIEKVDPLLLLAPAPVETQLASPSLPTQPAMPLTPASELISLPLQPVVFTEAKPSARQANRPAHETPEIKGSVQIVEVETTTTSIENEALEIELRELPPMVLPSVPSNLQPVRHEAPEADPVPLIPMLVDSLMPSPGAENPGSIQQVSWQVESDCCDSCDNRESNCNCGDCCGCDDCPDNCGECRDDGVCHEASVFNDDNATEACAPSLGLPGAKSPSATPLPAPPARQATATAERVELATTNSDRNIRPFRLATASDDNDFVIPVAAVEDLDSMVERIASSDGDFRAQPRIDKNAAPEKEISWREHLGDAISTLEQRMAATSDPVHREQLESKLQLLLLMPSELDHQQQKYVVALTDLLHTTADEDSHDKFTTGRTLEELRNAVTYLESIAAMRVANAVFCNEVTGFGQFVPVGQTTFFPGQHVLVYCEVENQSAQQRQINDESMYSTQLVGSFIVYDEAGQVVQQQEFPMVEDLARKRRRDFYMHLPFTIGQLEPGTYSYQLMIDDVGGGKSASLESMLEFTVKVD